MLTTQTVSRTTSRMASKSTRTRGTSRRILGLSPTVNRKFTRALLLKGELSKSSYIDTMVRRVIREAELQHGDLLKAMTAEENEIIAAIADGHAEPETIAAETLLRLDRVKRLLPGLVELGYLRTERKGGKTEGARGAVVTLYFLPRGK